MKSTFKEYHQFTAVELKQLWNDCLFVFDSNTLLNMYRYNHEITTAFFEALESLKGKNQLWIPYQVGYEFYENRIDVIYEYEESYDSILSILEKAKEAIKKKYKNHPSLDLKEIKQKMDDGLKPVETQINQAKKNHPKWMEDDDILDRINSLFDGNIGINYTEEQLTKIKGEGKDRYSKKIPPGYKDGGKPSNKYGDLILWYQIIDKAKEIKKPIIFISGDVKEDWWLEKNGKRIMPLPQLKQEMLEKANVDFHIYTADKFLEYSNIDNKVVEEVRDIRELEEEKMMMRRMLERDRELSHRGGKKYLIEYVHIFEKLERLFRKLKHSIVYIKYSKELDNILYIIITLRHKIMYNDFEGKSLHRLRIEIKKLNYFVDKITSIEVIDPILLMEIQELINRLDYLDHKINRDDL